ncbi:MAG: mycofactocin biosynthesis glycosyltransferase MftF [Acidimicrobiales bacterium]
MLDRRVRRLGRSGEVLLGGEPFRLLRLSGEAARLLDEPADGDTVTSPRRIELARLLVRGGFAHPIPAERPPSSDEVTVVVPVRDDDAAAARLLEELRAEFAGRVIVVDDGSLDASGVRLEAAAAAAGAELVRRCHPGGPASARNAARSLLSSPFVAFLDADARAPARWLDCLVGHFEDATVGAVAPRVRAVGTGALAAYESLGSPLDLGSQPGIVGAHRRLSYVPSAALVCRRAALEDVGWFEPELAVGEDVDLLRRLEEGGWGVRYEPRSVVGHDSRPGVFAFVRQRFAYGSSAAALERRHPGTVAPFEGNWRAVVAVLATAVVPLAFRRGDILGHRAATWVVFTAVPARSLRSKLRHLGVEAPTVAAVTTVARGQLWAIAGLATALRRVWWPPALVGALALRRLRRPVAGALLAVELASRLRLWLPLWWAARRAPAARSGLRPPEPAPRRPPAPWSVPHPGLLATLLYGLLDDLAYGAGVWAGCLRGRSLRAVLPRLAQRPADSPSSVPRRSR